VTATVQKFTDEEMVEATMHPATLPQIFLLLLLLRREDYILVNAWTAKLNSLRTSHNPSIFLRSSIKDRRRQHVLSNQRFSCSKDDEDTVKTPPRSLIVWQLNESDNADEQRLSWTRAPCDTRSREHASETSARVQNGAATQAATLTWNWCDHWVRQLDLCPWAKTSLETSGAIQFFVVPPLTNNQPEKMSRHVVEDVARRFMEEIIDADGHQPTRDEIVSMVPSSMERAAIFLILFLPANKQDAPSLLDNFLDFFEWFTDVEEEWDEALDDVIVAPFHPGWEFGTVDDEEQRLEQALSYEKKSPYALVSLVSSRVVEQAGEAVTSKIATQNRHVLLHMLAEVGNKDGLETLWRTAIYGEDTTKRP
jgi:hypothetical protein